MFVLLMHDGSREEVSTAERDDAIREAIRRGAVALEGAPLWPPFMRQDFMQAAGLGRAGLIDAFGPGWQPPTGAEVRELLKVARLTSSTAGRLLGVPGGKVRKWAGDDGAMPYAVWRLLLIYAGLVDAERMPDVK